MKLSHGLPSLLACTAWALPSESSALAPRDNEVAFPDRVSYFGVFYTGITSSIYFFLASSDNPYNFEPLNAGNPALDPATEKIGSGGVRDPNIVVGEGVDKDRKWYIIGTDLDTAKVDFDTAQRQGSRGIMVWDSTDLATWGNGRVVGVEGDDAGMVWSPRGIFDSRRNMYFVTWATRLFVASDSDHTGPLPPVVIRYTYTTDFQAFEVPKTLPLPGTEMTDVSYLSVTANLAMRFIRDESTHSVIGQLCNSSFIDSCQTVTDQAGNAMIRTGAESPFAWVDNVTKNKINLMMNFPDQGTSLPFWTDDIRTNSWQDAEHDNWSVNLKTGAIIGITQPQLTAIKAKWNK